MGFVGVASNAIWRWQRNKRRRQSLRLTRFSKEEYFVKCYQSISGLIMRAERLYYFILLNTSNSTCCS